MPDPRAAAPQPKATYTPGAPDVAGGTDPDAVSATYVPVQLYEVEGTTLVPTYTANASEDPFYQWIAQGAEIGLPVTGWPWEEDHWRTNWAYMPQARIAHAFHAAVWAGHTDVVGEMVTRGLVTPDAVSVWGATALVLAVSHGDTRMVKLLVALGSDVNRLCATPHAGPKLTDAQFDECGAALARGRGYHDPFKPRNAREGYPQRTPLMVAAAQGRIALVKLLCSLGADPAVVAPDGQIALRLASEAGHREVVDYLPATRKGAWLRWKTAHARTTEKIARQCGNLFWFTKLLVWDLPKALVWHLPRALGRALGHCAKRACAHPVEAATALCNVVASIWRGVFYVTRVLSRHLWRAIKETPRLIKVTIVTLPDRLYSLALTLWSCVYAVGAAIGRVLASLVSLVHTAIVTALSFLGRATLADVWAGFCAVLHAVFIGLPTLLGRGIVMAIKATEATIESGGLVGFVVGIVYVVSRVVLFLLVVILWIPGSIVEYAVGMLVSVVRFALYSAHEAMVWINPKY